MGEFEGRVAFLEDYEMHLAHRLVQGVDLWLNLPRVPQVYELDEVLGRGFSGTVWRGRRLSTDEAVAVKVFDPNMPDSSPITIDVFGSDPRALVEAFLAGDHEALSIVDGDPHAAQQPVEQEELIDLSGQYFVVDGDLTYRYVADEQLPGSRYEHYDDPFSRAACPCAPSRSSSSAPCSS